MKKIFFILTTVFLLASCANEDTDFLNDPKPSDELFDASPDQALIGTLGAYRDFYGGGHDVGTAKAFFLGADVMGRDLQVPDFNWYIFEHRWDVVTIPNARRNNYVWDMCYELAFHANATLKQIEFSPGNTPPSRLAIIKGSALALRALAHYDLIRSFQFTYAKNPNLPGVPLSIDLSGEHKGRGTVQEVYNQIYADLQAAIPLLPENSYLDNQKFHLNKNIAKGILARVALEKQDYALAAQMANEARQGYALMSETTYKAGFNDIANTEWMWGFPFKVDENWGYASFYSFIDHERTAGYKDIYVNSAFRDLFSDSDYRKSLIVASATPTTNGKQWRTRKFRDTSDLTGSMLLMRSAEMYLIEAEALAHSNLAAAKTLLHNFQLTRDASATLSTAATKELFIEEVLVERRKELYGELGTDYFDMKRHQKSMQRVGNATRAVVGYGVFDVIPATSNKWNFLIPQTEIDRNDVLTEADQNPL